MKRYANDKYYYWRDALTNPEAALNKKESMENRNKLDWMLSLPN
ncbi:MAG TPA: hypothetical protein P5107_10040 [Thermotogota bacterium]|nr:hypothetical protein [Thermotogota bacterium]HRW35382.1 hypothetical protein [Thermotogota bacterium]